MTRRSSDESAEIGRLYDRFGAGLYRYAVMVLADPSAASDVVQQVFAAVIERRPGIDDAEHYLRRAVRNECYSTLRRRRREERAITESPLLEPIAGCADPAARLMIEGALSRLPAEQRASEGP
jgi:DNA-directed RNA polymerase specialized sigma24 family protein